MVISTEVEKAFDKIHYPLMILKNLLVKLVKREHTSR